MNNIIPPKALLTICSTFEGLKYCVGVRCGDRFVGEYTFDSQIEAEAFIMGVEGNNDLGN